ncbi:hypothetical protein D3C74_391470 [compost metagenome]
MPSKPSAQRARMLPMLLPALPSDHSYDPQKKSVAGQEEIPGPVSDSRKFVQLELILWEQGDGKQYRD